MKKLISLLFILVAFIFTVPVHAAAYVNLPVPFTAEAPLGKWIDQWFNGCEEASVVMVDQYYLGNKTLSSSDAATAMTRLFAWEDNNFGYNTDANATETARMINEYSSYKAVIKRHPTLGDIKAELEAGHPVIAPIDGIAFYHKKYGMGYHMLVIKGYDQVNQEFIVNDDGSNSHGRDYRVSYQDMMSALNDYDHATQKLSDVPTAIFTYTEDGSKMNNAIIITSKTTPVEIYDPKYTPITQPAPAKVAIPERIWRFIRSLFTYDSSK